VLALLAGICIKRPTTFCKPGDFQIAPIYALMGTFLLIAFIGVGWLSWRNRR
jgi:hypothetical protein